MSSAPRVDAERIKDVDLTVTVFDRFNGRLVESGSGVVDELVPTEPIRAAPLRVQRKHTPREHVQVQLYNLTHRDGAGWHYEWLSAVGGDGEGSSPEPSIEGQSSGGVAAPSSAEAA